MKSNLEQAYRDTLYQVYLPSGAVALRVDQTDAHFERWLSEENIAQWAILTAFNPGGVCYADDDNNAVQSALEIDLLEAGFEPYSGENIAASGDWPNEQTCLVPHISLDLALASARKFQQNAFIHGGADGVPRLIWVDREP